MPHFSHGNNQVMAKTFSIVTYNIHKGFGVGAFRYHLPQMKIKLLALNPDVLFLQEVQGAHLKRAQKIENWPLLPQSDYLAEHMWPYTVYGQNAVYASGHHGNAILSKFPLTSTHNLNLTRFKRASRSLLHSEVLLPGNRIVHFICVHLGLFKKERRNQCEQLIEYIETTIPSTAPLIMAGDFNDWQQVLSKRLAAQLAIQEAFYDVEGGHARSFPALRPAFPIDRIYYRGLTVESALCLNDKKWRMLSDHLPLYAKFSMS